MLPLRNVDNVNCNLKLYLQKLRNIESPGPSPTMDKSSETDSEQYVLALDVGTTTLRSHIYSSKGCIKGSSSKRVSCFKNIQIGILLKIKIN